MLVLSRKIGESIAIGEGVRVQVTRIERDRVTIGIDAPREIAIRRSELKPREIAIRRSELKPLNFG